MERHPDGSILLTGDEVSDLREVLHFLTEMTRAFNGKQGIDMHRKLVRLRRGLGVVPSDVGQARDRWDLPDRGVEPVMVVLVEPAREGFSAG